MRSYLHDTVKCRVLAMSGIRYMIIMSGCIYVQTREYIIYFSTSCYSQVSDLVHLDNNSGRSVLDVDLLSTFFSLNPRNQVKQINERKLNEVRTFAHHMPNKYNINNIMKWIRWHLIIIGKLIGLCIGFMRDESTCSMFNVQSCFDINHWISVSLITINI